MNYARTALLLAAMTALFLGIGFLLGGEAGMLLALAFAVATNAFAYWNADKLVLRMHGAREVDRRSARNSSAWSSSWPAAPGCPCPRCI